MSEIAAATGLRPNVDLGKAAELGNQLLQEINGQREIETVAWNDSVNGWIVTGWKDVHDGFLGKVPLSCVRIHTAFQHIPKEVQEQEFPRVVRAIPNWVLNSDPPLHTRLRLLMMKAFSRKVADGMRTFERQIVKEALDRAEAKGRIEFIDEIARNIAGRAIMKLLGVPDEHGARLEEWSYAINVAFGTPHVSIETVKAADRALGEMEKVFAEQIAIRRANPADDFLSYLVNAREGDDRLTDEEIYGTLHISLIAGHDTTMNTMGLGVLELSHNRAAREAIVSATGSELTDKLMELMRFIAMSSAFPRTAAEDFEWHGHQIKAGETVVLMIAGANRDPRVFPDPEQINFAENPLDKILVFGGGRHHCIGHFIAKMQLEEFFPVFFERFDVRILDDELNWWPVFSQRGLKSLNLEVTPRVRQ